MDKIENNYEQWMNDLESVAKIGRWEVHLKEESTQWTQGVFRIYEISDFIIPSNHEHLEFYPVDQRDRVQRAFKNLIEHEESFELESQIRTKKGNVKWVRILGKYLDANTIFGTIQDITNDVNLELRTQQLINNTEESFEIVGEDFNIITFNRQFKENFSTYIGRDIKVGESILEYTSNERKEELKKVYQTVFKGGTVERKLEIKSPEEEVKIFKLLYKPIKSIQNQTIDTFVSIKDITQEEEARKNLIKSEQKFRALVENGNDGTAILDSSGNLKYITPSIQGMLGYSMDEVYTKNLLELTHPTDLPKVQEKVIDSLNNPGVTIPGTLARLKHKDGSWRWFEAVVTNLLHDPAVQGIVDNFSDVTDRVEAEEKFEQAQQKLEKYLINSPLGIVEYDKNLYITRWSEKCEEIFGWTEKEVLAKNMTAFDMIYQEDKPLVKNIAEELNSDDIHGNISVNRNYTKNGEIIDCVWYNSAIKDSDGKTISIMSLVQDITVSAEADRKLHKSNEEKSVMLAEIHHRVKNNLAIVSGLLELQAFDSSNNILQHALVDSVNRIKSIALVHEQLYHSHDFARIKVDHNIRQLVDHLSSIMKTNKDIQIEYDLEEMELNINLAIPFALFINEAVSNVYKHAFTNRNKGKLKITCKLNNDEVIIRISDNGIGFSKAKGDDYKRSPRLGLQLLDMLTLQLSGKLIFENKQGTTVELSFMNDYKEKGSSATVMSFEE